jgi:hypothetical protein
VLVIDREVHRDVPTRDIEVVRQAMAAGVESVSFTSAGHVVRARIVGVEVAWAPERRGTTNLLGDDSPGKTDCPSCAVRSTHSTRGELL